MPPIPRSGAGADSRVTNTSSYFPNSKKLIFFTEYHFKPDGVTAIKKRIGKVLRTKELEIPIYDWSDYYQAFQVRCTSKDAREVENIFRNAIRDYINEEVALAKNNDDDDEDDDDDREKGRILRGDREYISEFFDPTATITSTKIQLLSVWKHEIQANGASKSVDDNEEMEQYSQPLPTPTSMSPRHFSTLNIEETWFCNSNDSYDEPNDKVNDKPTAKLNDIVSDFDLAELQRLTGCQLFKDGGIGKIIIGGNLQEDCDLALLKLDNMRKYYAPPNSCHINHLFYNEDDENIKLCLKLFKTLGRNYLKSTILDNLHVIMYEPDSDFRNLYEAITVRSAPYNQLRSLFLPTEENYGKQQPVEVPDPNQALKEWAQFKYQAKGAPDKCPTVIYFGPAGSPDASLVARGSLDLVQPVAPVQTAVERAGPVEAINMWRQSIPAVILGPGEIQPPKSLWDKPAVRPTWDKYKTHDEAILLEKINKKKDAIPQSQTSKGLISNLDSMRRAHSTSVIPFNGSRSSRSDESSPSLENAPPSATQGKLPPPHVRGFSLSSKSPGLSLSISQPLQPRETPDLLSEDIPTMDFSDYAVQAPADTDKLTPQDLARLDDDFFAAFDMVQGLCAPRQQEVDEIATRTFHNTMAQFAPKRGSQSPKKRNPFEGRLEIPDFSAPRKAPANEIEVVDPSPEFIVDFNEAFAGMANNLRGYRGQLTVQVEFGRVILRKFKKQKLTNKDVNNLFDVSEIQRLLYNPTNDGPVCVFTPVLTTCPGEIPPILATKDISGELLWAQKSPKWNVSYEFTFRDKTLDTRFTVEIDAETFDTEVKTCREVANIFVHGTKRYNDYRIVATGYEHLDNKYGHVATALESSLWIPANKTEPELFWTMNSKMADLFALDDVTVRRVCQYKGKDNKSILKASECIALDTNGARNDENTLIVFSAMPGPTGRRPWEKLNRWYEVAISSSEFDKLLEQNKSLELGDEAGWTVEKLADIGAAETFILPACQMLKQMDGIGCRNENGVPFAQFQEFAQTQRPVQTIMHETFW